MLTFRQGKNHHVILSINYLYQFTSLPVYQGIQKQPFTLTLTSMGDSFVPEWAEGHVGWAEDSNCLCLDETFVISVKHTGYFKRSLFPGKLNCVVGWRMIKKSLGADAQSQMLSHLLTPDQLLREEDVLVEFTVTKIRRWKPLILMPGRCGGSFRCSTIR